MLMYRCYNIVKINEIIAPLNIELATFAYNFS